MLDAIIGCIYVPWNELKSTSKLTATRILDKGKVQEELLKGLAWDDFFTVVFSVRRQKKQGIGVIKGSEIAVYKPHNNVFSFYDIQLTCIATSDKSTTSSFLPHFKTMSCTGRCSVSMTSPSIRP